MSVYLETDRLRLRQMTSRDEDDLVDLDSDPAVMRFITGGRATSRAEMRDEILPFWLAFHERGEPFGFWIAELRGTGAFLGWFHLRARRGDDPGRGVELGYRLRRSAWGRGYATEGSRALIDLPPGVARAHPGRRARRRRVRPDPHRVAAGPRQTRAAALTPGLRPLSGGTCPRTG